MSTVTRSITRPVAELDAMWVEVALGRAPADWFDKLPAEIRAETLDALPNPARDIAVTVGMDGEDLVRFTATARTP